MEYHTPDTTWAALGYHTFEAFKDKHVIKGRFHKLVPEDVTKSYRVAEYIMAHSWYHYPMYDEAMSKLGVIFEMAVKKRCLDLNIPSKKPNWKGKLINKTLNDFCNNLDKAEPGKKIFLALDWVRELRNMVLHRDKYGFSGAGINHSLAEVVNIINTIFLPEDVVASFYKEKERISGHDGLAKGKPYTVTVGDTRFLVENITWQAAIQDENGWVYLLRASHILKDFPGVLKRQTAVEPFNIALTGIIVHDRSLDATEVTAGKKVMIRIADDPNHLAAFREQVSGWESGDQFDKHLYTLHIDHHAADVETLFQYRHLCSVLPELLGDHIKDGDTE